MEELKKEMADRWLKLANYLSDEKVDGKTIFTLSFQDGCNFIIHPEGKNGNTLDLSICIHLQPVTAKTEQERFEDEIILTLDYDVQFKKQEPQFDNNCKADDDFVKAYEQEHQTADDEEQFDYNKWINDSQTQDELYKAVKWCSERAFDIGDVPLLLVEFASQEHPQLIVAKSGRKYRSIPEGMDIETWDTMTPAERLNYRGLIEHPQITGEIYDILDCIAKFDINAETYEKADYFEVIQKDVQKWLRDRSKTR